MPQSVLGSRPQASETQRARLLSWLERKQLRDGDPLTNSPHFTTMDPGAWRGFFFFFFSFFLDNMKLSWSLGRGWRRAPARCSIPRSACQDDQESRVG